MSTKNYSTRDREAAAADALGATKIEPPQGEKAGSKPYRLRSGKVVFFKFAKAPDPRDGTYFFGVSNLPRIKRLGVDAILFLMGTEGVAEIRIEGLERQWSRLPQARVKGDNQPRIHIRRTEEGAELRGFADLRVGFTPFDLKQQEIMEAVL